MFHQTLKDLRLAHDMNQVELAKRLSVTKQSVSNWENDNIQPSVEMVIKIAQLFNVSVDYLLGTSSEKNINVDGLTNKQIAHISMLVSDLRSINK